MLPPIVLAIKGVMKGAAFGPAGLIAAGTIAVGIIIFAEIVAHNRRNELPSRNVAIKPIPDRYNTKKNKTNSEQQKKESKKAPTDKSRVTSEKNKSRTKSDQRKDPNSTSNDTEADHLEDRFERFIHFGGYIQSIAEMTNIPRNEVVTGGRSLSQDRRSGLGNEYHAAHVVRLRPNPRLREYPQIYIIINNFLGHTQIVGSWANYWSGIGGDIDRFQERALARLNTIDFSGNLSEADRETLENLKYEYIAILDKYINNPLRSDPEIEKLVKMAISKLINTSIESLFEIGKEGYKGEKMKTYA